MADHRARPRARRRLLYVAVGLVASFLLVTGGGSTGAYWTDVESIDAGTLSSGTLDVVLNADPSDAVTLPSLTVGDLLPGDSRAATIEVKNAGLEAPLRFSVAGRATGELVPNLRVQLFDGTAQNTGGSSTGYGSSCSGSSITSELTLTAGDTTMLTVAASQSRTAVVPTATQNLCVRLSVPAAAPQAAQGKSAVVTLVVTGRSVVR